MGNKRNRRSRRAQSTSPERDSSASEVRTFLCYETLIETLSNFENVSSVREGERAIVSGSQNEEKKQVWTQIITDKTYTVRIYQS